MTPDEIRPKGHGGQSTGAGEFREKAHDVARDVREMGEAAREMAREKAEQARRAGEEYYEKGRDFAREKAEQARRAGEDYFEKGRDFAREYEDQVVDYVRANPLKSLLIALCAGLVLGSLTRR